MCVCTPLHPTQSPHDPSQPSPYTSPSNPVPTTLLLTQSLHLLRAPLLQHSPKPCTALSEALQRVQALQQVRSLQRVQPLQRVGHAVWCVCIAHAHAPCVSGYFISKPQSHYYCTAEAKVTTALQTPNAQTPKWLLHYRLRTASLAMCHCLAQSDKSITDCALQTAEQAAQHC